MRISKLNQVTPDELRAIVAKASSLKMILDFLNLSTRCENYHRLRSKLDELNIDYSHIRLGAIRPTLVRRERAYNYRNFDINDFLIEKSIMTRASLKLHLLKLGLLENKCNICGQLPEWNGKPLVLQIDHINGVYNDNRLQNLRILCGHCHSQTVTFAGKAISLTRLEKETFHCKCGAVVSVKNVSCVVCSRKSSSFFKRKVERPSKEDLHKLLWEEPTMHLAKKFGVSGKAIEKWAKAYGISKPPRGYWRKVQVGK